MLLLLTTKEVFSNLPYRIFKGKNNSSCTLYLNDCLEGMRNCLKDNSIDIVVTSPPYNIDVKYNSYKDTLPKEDYLAWLKKVGIEISRVLKKDGTFFLNV